MDAHKGLQPWKKSLGEQIKSRRENLRLSQDALAEAVDISRNMITRYEAGIAAPSVDILGLIARRLGMPTVTINGSRFAIGPHTDEVSPQPEQLCLEFGKEHVYAGATLRITPTKLTLTITTTVPSAA
jgi:transcriptional regulator with XRE-family HTH domain